MNDSEISTSPDLPETATPLPPEEATPPAAEESASVAEGSAPADEPRQVPPPLSVLSVQDLHALTHAELVERAKQYAVRLRLEGTKYHLCLDQIRYHLSTGTVVRAEGILEIAAPNGQHGQLRWPDRKSVV